MSNNRVVEIKTGKPIDSLSEGVVGALLIDEKGLETIYEAKGEIVMPTYEEQHAELCRSTKEMLIHMRTSLEGLSELASKDAKLLRSIRWEEEGLGTVGIPVMLRSIRSNLEWLQEFFAKEWGR